MDASNPTTRFSNRVADYVRHRPGYPLEVLACLVTEFGLNSHHVVADVGSGTGILTEMLLRAGRTVYAIEPNRDMRAAAEESLSRFPGFHSLDGSAEDTSLPNASVDWITAAQAFHWFDVDRARAEAVRILRPGGRVALLWNNRREDTPMLREYEALLQEFGIDYARIKHQNAEADGRIPRFFGGREFALRSFRNAQSCDFDSLKGRTLSASYMPAVDHTRYPAMIEALRSLYDAHQEKDSIRIDYETRMYVGPIHADG